MNNQPQEYYTPYQLKFPIEIEKSMCQVKVGNNLQNCHNAQNQIEQSVKGLVREMFLSHFKLG